jgi:small subunit ribosomal protein S6
MVVQKQYESTYIVTPELETSAYEQIIERINNLMASSGAEIVNQEIWGFKKLAYEINRKQTGYYVYTEFKASPEFITRLEREYQYIESIMRFLTVSLDKHAVAYNQRRKAKLEGRIVEPEPDLEPNFEPVLD